MKNPNYIYSTAEASKFYGLTRKGLSFYEEKGIISPSRTENNKYRIYTLEDCYSLYHAKLYSNCNFTLAEIADMIQGGGETEFVEQMKKKQEIIEKDILLRQRMLFHAGRITNIMEHLDEYMQFKIVESPDFYRLFVRKYNEKHTSSQAQSLEFEEWNRTIPINTASLKYSIDEVRENRETLNVGIGNIISAQDFGTFDYQVSERVEFIPSQKCLYAVLCVDGEHIYKKDWLTPAFQYMKEQQLECVGDPFTSMLVVLQTGAGKVRYEEVWFPVS